MKKALINSGKIRQVVNPGEEFDVAPGFDWVDCPDACTPEWSYDGVDFTAPPNRSAATMKPIVLADLAAKRYAVETGGILHAGQTVDTDRDAQSKLIAARTLAKEAKDAAAPYSQDWKTQDGWLTLDADGMIALAEAVLAHVQGAFATEKTKADEINALTTVAALDAYDINSGW